jgi:hypothetical protein
MIVNVELLAWLVGDVGLLSGSSGSCWEVYLLAERCKTLAWGVRLRVWEWGPSPSEFW